MNYIEELNTLFPCKEALGYAVWGYAVHGRTRQEAWDKCQRPVWLMWTIIKTIKFLQGDNNHMRLLACLCDMVEPALTDKAAVARDIIQTVRGYTEDKASLEDVEAVDREAREAREATATETAWTEDAANELVWAIWIVRVVKDADADATADAVVWLASISGKQASDTIHKHYPDAPRLGRVVSDGD